MSLNSLSVCRYKKKCNLKLYYEKWKAFINFAQKHRRVLWARSHLRWTEGQWKRVHISACFFGKMDVGFYVPKMKKTTIQTVTNEKHKNQPL